MVDTWNLQPLRFCIWDPLEPIGLDLKLSMINYWMNQLVMSYFYRVWVIVMSPLSHQNRIIIHISSNSRNRFYLTVSLPNKSSNWNVPKKDRFLLYSNSSTMYTSNWFHGFLNADVDKYPAYLFYHSQRMYVHSTQIWLYKCLEPLLSYI